MNAISWNARDVELLLFVIWPSRNTAGIPLLTAEPTPDGLRSYFLEDPDIHLPGRDCFEYDLVFESMPDDLASVVTAWLSAAIKTGAVIAWFAFEGSFSFEHLLKADVANQVYAMADSDGVQLALDDATRHSMEWISAQSDARTRIGL
ncbi:hypothetical protein ASF62_11095 [Leifsonia sp. Leaf325]|nr:hypothetical protein ASF62_11095 [Leifsonia sp. Leaf325]